MRTLLTLQAYLCLAGAIFTWAAATRLNAEELSDKNAEELSGKQLFVRKWVAHDTRSPSGDGLGPLHNATSCVACHHQGGPGGGGGREHNVDLISVKPQGAAAGGGPDQRFIKELTEVHPGFDSGRGLRANLVLHRFGPEADYYSFRAKLLGIEEPRPDEEPARRAIAAASLARRKAKSAAPVEILGHGNVTLLRSQRNTPALWGAGLIDAISPLLLEAIAAKQANDSQGISGRVPRASGGGVGRFGWRGQTATLREFVLAACANELGLQTAGHAQATNPLANHYKGPGSDLSVADAEALVGFTASLAKPMVREPRTAAEREAFSDGAKTFERVGCSDCHVRQLGVVDGIFSDLLLHDLGPALEDPVEPNPPTRTVEVGFVGYSGSGSVFREEEVAIDGLAREWRTPPLWGVADSAPYMHDGRAETLADAIKLHDGEAKGARQQYLQATSEQRTHLIFFLKCLAAPARDGRE